MIGYGCGKNQGYAQFRRLRISSTNGTNRGYHDKYLLSWRKNHHGFPGMVRSFCSDFSDVAIRQTHDGERPMILENTMTMMTMNVFDFQREPKYTFTGYYSNDKKNEKGFTKKMTVPDAIDFFHGFLHEDTSISMLESSDGFDESISLISDFGSVYAECETRGVIEKIGRELRRLKNKSNRGYYS